jgi:rSAM/selenodomain-associated transferase 2
MEAAMSGSAVTFSVIVPTLNEADNIQRCIANIQAIDPAVEIIIADGGSTDDTVQLAAAAGATICRASRGRGPQCNAGAACTTGNVLLFLHADTQLPSNAFTLLREIFAAPDVQCAKFRLWFDTRDWLLDLAAICMWIDTIMTSYGDQCIVVRHTFFRDLGGFPAWPLFEDVNFFERARERTSVYVVPACVITSARRFLQNGVVNQLLHDFWLMLQYLWGIPPQQIAETYERQGAVLRSA